MFKIFVVLVIVFVSCKPVKETNKLSKSNFKSVNNKSTYNFNAPILFELESSLREISGLSYANGYLYTHNDEEGKLFKLSIKGGKTISTHTFGKDDDYEGIEVVGDTSIIVKSNGDLLFYNMKSEESKIIKTKFSTHNDVEGLGYNPIENELLIACKGQMLKDDGKNKEKGIYKYDLEANKLNKKPFLVIKDKVIKKYFEKKYSKNDVSKKQQKKLLMRALDFSPSGITIHPKTKDYYIISARGSVLLVFDSEKELKNIVFLNEKQLPQPEGVCFDADTNLYISTESKGDGGRIYKYTTGLK